MTKTASDKQRGHVFPRRLDPPLPLVAEAEGVWIEDNRGHRFLDASGGAVVVNVGHGRDAIARAVHDQILSHDYIHPTMMSTPVVEELAAALAGHAPSGIDRFYFLSSGSEAVEAAIKLARQIHLALERPQKFRLISRWKSYHGLSLGALSAMGRTAFRTPFAPMLGDAVHIPGLELTFSYLFDTESGWELPFQLAYTWMNAEFQSSFVSDYFGQVNKGDPVPYVPENQLWASLGLEKDAWSFHASANYVGSVCTEASCGAFEKTESATIFDLSAHYRINDSWRLYALVENLSDEIYVAARDPYGARPNKPRTFLMGVKFGF